MMRKKKRLVSLVLILSIAFHLTSSVYAGTRAYDTYNKTCSKDFYMSKTMLSISPPVAAKDTPDDIRNVTFAVRLTGNIQYDRISNKYVAASSPAVSLTDSGRVVLNLYPVSTGYRDNGNSITFYFKGTLVGTVNMDIAAIPCTVQYGTISQEFTVNK